MASQRENPKQHRNMDERMEALTANVEKLTSTVNDIAFSQKLHADMLVSLDTQMQQLTANVDKLTIDVRDLTEISKRNTENAARLDIKFERLAEIMTGLFQKHDERIGAIERNQ